MVCGSVRGYRCPPHDRQAQAVFQGVRVTQPGPRGGLATDGQPGSGMPLGQRWSSWAPWSMEASRISLPQGGGQLGHGEDGGAQLGADLITGSEPSIVRGAVGLRGNRWAGGALNDPACSPVSGEPVVWAWEWGGHGAHSASSLLLGGALGRALGSAGGSEQGGVREPLTAAHTPVPPQGRGPWRPRTGTRLERLSRLVHSAGRPPGC